MRRSTQLVASAHRGAPLYRHYVPDMRTRKNVLVMMGVFFQSCLKRSTTLASPKSSSSIRPSPSSSSKSSSSKLSSVSSPSSSEESAPAPPRRPLACSAARYGVDYFGHMISIVFNPRKSCSCVLRILHIADSAALFLGAKTAVSTSHIVAANSNCNLPSCVYKSLAPHHEALKLALGLRGCGTMRHVERAGREALHRRVRLSTGAANQNSATPRKNGVETRPTLQKISTSVKPD